MAAPHFACVTDPYGQHRAPRILLAAGHAVRRTCRLAEGAEVVGRRVLAGEDLVTSGGQIVLPTADRRPPTADRRPPTCGLGAVVSEALSVIGREQGGGDALTVESISLLSLLIAEDLRTAATG